MILRFVNSAILGLIFALTLTGLYSLVWPMPLWMYEIHRICGWALIFLIPWKSAISLRSLGRGLRPTFDRGVVIIVSLALSGATIVVIGLGLMWAWRLGPETLWLNQSTISWHWILALVILPPFALHAWRRWPRPKQEELLSRRGLMQIGGLTAASLAGRWLAERYSDARQLAEHPRRASGSQLQGYLSGNDFPVTTGAGDAGSPIDPQSWQLAITGLVAQPLTFTYSELLALPLRSRVATIDCTVGWYSVQRWRGVSLPYLLEQAGADADARGVRLVARSGHRESLPMRELEPVLLASHVGGVPLAHRHGFPLRAVVPTRRGWFWVKWLTAIEVFA
jgi:hypothetical protein